MPPMNRTIKKAKPSNSGMSFHNFKSNVKNEVSAFKKVFSEIKNVKLRKRVK